MKKQNIVLIRIITALTMFAVSFFLPRNIYVWGFVVSYIIAAYNVLIKAVKNVIALNPMDENFLMAIASVGAFIIGEYTEGAAVMIFYQVGEAFQHHAVSKSRRSIAELMDICPDFANVEKDGAVIRVSPEEVTPGDIIIIKPGEKIPLDGVIVSGCTTVDTAAITGEALPRTMKENDEVISGCVNLDGMIKVRVTSEYECSTVVKILETVENSAAKKAKSEKFITVFAGYYTPIVVVCALMLAVIPPLFGASWSEQLRRALIFLVVSCPCALVISVPLTFFGAIGGASRRGILIKGSEYIDRLSTARAVAFDKTGTLTEGNFHVKTVCAAGITDEELIKTVAYAEALNEHPIAKSLKAQYGGNIEPDKIKSSAVIHGGVKTLLDKDVIYVGNKKLMQAVGVTVPEVNSEADAVVHAAKNGEYIGYFIIGDRVKSTSRSAVQELHKMGIENISLVTGDIDSSAQSVAAELGITQVHSQLLPQDKVDVIEKLSQKHNVIFVGDGINDAPVLARSDVGVSMGLSGSGAAIEASDAVLMSNDPMKLCELIRLSRKAMRIVRQNIVFALAVKLIVLLLTTAGISTMWEAVFADVGVSVAVIINAMRMLKK